MRFLDDAWRIFENSSGIKTKSLMYFLLGVTGAALTASGLYWAMFGYKHWTGEMAVAGRIMTAAAISPASGTPGQYVCPVHGAVGMPRFDATGTPRCPVGGEVMQFRNLVVAGASPAAFAGG
jgi:hypothetical protein